MKRVMLWLTAVGTFMAAVTVQGHHSFSAEFDVNQPVSLEGEVIKMEWVNPHSWLHIEVVNEEGETERWRIEGGAPSALLRRGWDRDSLPPGTKISVEGYQARNGDRKVNARNIVFPDGRKMNIGSSGRGSAPESPDEESSEE